LTFPAQIEASEPWNQFAISWIRSLPSGDVSSAFSVVCEKRRDP
jgi:hypothetical protein